MYSLSLWRGQRFFGASEFGADTWESNPAAEEGISGVTFDCALVELAGIQKKPIDRLPSKRCSSLIPRFLRAWSKHTLYLMYVVCRPGLVILWVRFSAAFRTSLRFIGSVRKLVNHTSHSFCAMGWCARVLAVYSSCLRMCSACSAARFYEAFRSSAALNSASRFSAAAFACAAAVSRTLCCSTVRLNLISLRPVPASRCRRVSTIRLQLNWAQHEQALTVILWQFSEPLALQRCWIHSITAGGYLAIHVRPATCSWGHAIASAPTCTGGQALQRFDATGHAVLSGLHGEQIDRPAEATGRRYLCGGGSHLFPRHQLFGCFHAEWRLRVGKLCIWQYHRGPAPSGRRGWHQHVFEPWLIDRWHPEDDAHTVIGRNGWWIYTKVLAWTVIVWRRSAVLIRNVQMATAATPLDTRKSRSSVVRAPKLIEPPKLKLPAAKLRIAPSQRMPICRLGRVPLF